MAMNLSRLRPDWRMVRGLGQLQLLNRASMFMIIFVPILTSLWSVVLQWLGWNGSNPALPESWALLFFGSLATLVGRTTFQLRCPDVVKYRGLDDYIREKKREYSESPSQSAVTNAIEYLKKLKIETALIDQEEKVEADAQVRRQELKAELENVRGEIDQLNEERKNTANEADWENLNRSRLRDLSYVVTERRQNLLKVDERDRGDRGPDFRRRMALVEYTAQHFYLAQAKTAPISMLFCAIAYGFAIVFIVKVIVKQALAVASAAGWG